ncbi:MAG: cache domain-containing protein [Isosphaeraceae bacterium]
MQPTPSAHGSSVRTRLRQAIIVVPCLVLLLAALIFWLMTSHYVNQQASRKAEVEIDAVARSVVDFFDRAEVIVRGVASRQSTLGSQPDPDTIPILRDLLASIYTADRDDPVQGVYIAFEYRKANDPDALQWVDQHHWGTRSRVDYDYHDRHKDRQWYWGAKDLAGQRDPTNVTEPYFDEGGGNSWMVSVTQPVVDPRGAFVGVAGVDLDMARLQQRVQKLSFGDDLSPRATKGYAYLVSPGGQVFALPDDIQTALGGMPQVAMPLDRLPEAEAELITGKESGRLEPVQPPSGETRLVSWKTFLGRWRVVVNKPSGPVYAPAKAVTTWTIGLGSLLMALMIGIVARVADRVVGPIHRLTAAAAAVEAGDYRPNGLTEVAERRDEFGQLARGFGRMVEVVSGREAELLAARNELEGRERYFRALIDNASDIVTVVCPDGRICYKSPSVRRILGWGPEDLVGAARRISSTRTTARPSSPRSTG